VSATVLSARQCANNLLGDVEGICAARVARHGKEECLAPSRHAWFPRRCEGLAADAERPVSRMFTASNGLPNCEASGMLGSCMKPLE